MKSYATDANQRAINDLIQVGKVLKVDPEKQTADVDVLGNHYLGLKWITGAASDDLIWNSPRPGSQVLIASLSGGLENGVILGSIFGTHKPKTTKESLEITSIEFADGTRIAYDKAKHVLDIDGSKSKATFNIKTAGNNVNVDGKNVVLNGGNMGGVICEKHIDLFTGSPRPSSATYVSKTVKSGG